MKDINRRSFLKKSTAVYAGVMASQAMAVASPKKSRPSDTINIAVIGIRSRGRDHYRALSKIPNVKVAMLCDIDERFFPETVAEVEKLTGNKPATTNEFRKVLDNPDIDAVSIATPNHWHGLQTIWACQAGKDVYVEKPVSHTVLEGRKMVEAARKYDRIVQTGTQSRSNESVIKAFDFLQEGGLGDVYMSKGLCLKPRATIGHTKNGSVPAGVNWDAFLGPAPYRPFNENRFHYRWHWFWDTGCGDLGNQGIHQTDLARWALNKWTHPVKIHGTGNYFVFDSDQETPNIQHLEFVYEDGTMLQFDVRGLGTNPDGEVRIGNLFYGSKGWMQIASEDEGNSRVTYADVQMTPTGFSAYKETPGPTFTNDDPAMADAVVNHFTNFLDCVRSRNRQALHADILEGHLSSALCHLGNIATRLNRSLNFNPQSETFVNDAEADSYLTKAYRYPYVLPEQV